MKCRTCGDDLVRLLGEHDYYCPRCTVIRDLDGRLISGGSMSQDNAPANPAPGQLAALGDRYGQVKFDDDLLVRYREFQSAAQGLAARVDQTALGYAMTGSGQTVLDRIDEAVMWHSRELRVIQQGRDAMRAKLGVGS